MKNPAIADKTSELDAIIRPLSAASYTVDYSWKDIARMLSWLAEGSGAEVELVPDFQRGHVWTQHQQEHFIENVLRGVVTLADLTIRFNAPAWNSAPSGDLSPRVQCIDGLQRLTAIRRFVNGEIRAFGLTAEDLNDSQYRVLEGAGGRFRMKVAIYTFQNRADLLQHYLDLNAGGTPHSPSEIDRVRKLLEDASIAKTN